MRRDGIALLIFVGICLAVEFVSGWSTQSSVRDWYLQIRKPSWTPPGWIFAPVWTYLYITMGVAAWLVWRGREHPAATASLWLFGLQLLFNGLWSVVFFGLRQPGWGLVDISLLWIVLLAATVFFFRVSPTAGFLMVPYLLWVSFASALNFSIWRLNS